MASKKIRIIYQITPQIIGGAERFLLSLLTHLDKRVFEPLAFFANDGVTVNLFRKSGIKTKVIANTSSDNLSGLINFIKESGQDISQTNGFSSSLALASYRAGIPHIWRIGGDIKISLPLLNAKQREIYLNIICKLSERIICPSGFLSRQFKGMDEKKVSVIYNGINLIPKSRMKPIKDRAKQRQVNIGMVAHLVPQKRHSDFISAAKLIAREVPGSKFFIIGAPYPSHKSHAYANKLRRIAKATRINKRLVFTGFISNTLKAISELDLVVLPSTDEGASNVIMEAMMLSKPLVAYESGSNSEFIENRVGGLLVPSKDYRRLASAAIKICKDKELAIQMGNAAREKAQKLFDIRNTALSYAALYKRVRKANRF